MDEGNLSSITPIQPVEFLGVLDQYLFNEDLRCIIKFNNYTVQEGDRVAVFKIGWIAVKEYYVFEWIPLTAKDQYSIVFFQHMLPKSSQQLYQLCYVSGENEIQGASTPFQFVQNNIPFNKAATLPSKCCCLSSEVVELREENAMLKKTLKLLLKQKTYNNPGKKSCDTEISEIKHLVECLSTTVGQHQTEINMLKNKIREGGEEYKKLYVEKAKVERKYERLRSKTSVEKERKAQRHSDSESLSNDKSVRPICVKEHKTHVHSDFDFKLESLPPFPSMP